MTPFQPSQHPHRRWNPLLQTFVLCSPHRTQRPWQGAQESADLPLLPAYLDTCYLCPGNTRATGAQNDPYTQTFVFENDFAALKDVQVEAQDTDTHFGLFRIAPARGKCYVVCFHPHHNLTLAQMTTAPYSAETHIIPIIHAWRDMYMRISAENPFVQYIQLFENKGSAMGCSNPHPHGQIWALDYVPTEPMKVMKSMYEFSADPANEHAPGPRHPHGRPHLLLAYAHMELHAPGRPRVVTLNHDFVALVPFWAVWPFEIMVLPYKRFLGSLQDFTEAEISSLAHILGEVTCRYDNLFRTSFPYSMGIHQKPVPHAQDSLALYALFHIHFYPPLLRSATVRKFLVGYVFLHASLTLGLKCWQSHNGISPQKVRRKDYEHAIRHTTSPVTRVHKML